MYIVVVRPSVLLSIPLTLCSQLLLNPLGDFNETWYKERSQSLVIVLMCVL
jgi:hypothetical protein